MQENHLECITSYLLPHGKECTSKPMGGHMTSLQTQITVKKTGKKIEILNFRQS